jgi:hypothetical protein
LATVAELEVRLTADTGDASSKLSKVGNSMDDLGKKAKGASGKTGGLSEGIKGGLVGGLVASLNPIGLVANGIGGLTNLLGDAVKAAQEEEVGVQRLTQALKNNISGFDGNVGVMDEFIRKGEALAFADDQIRDSLAQLVGVTDDVETSQRASAAAMDLARAKNISLKDATNIVAGALTGKTAALKKMGIAITKGAEDTEIFAAIQANAGGQAEAFANTSAGAAERIQNTMGNAMETMGAIILPKLTIAMSAVADFISSPAFQGGFEFLANLVGGTLTTAFDVFGNVLGVVMGIVQPFADIIGGFIGALQSGQDPMNAFGEMLGNVGKAFQELGGKIISWISEVGPQILGKLAEWGRAFVEWIGPKIVPMLAELARLGGALLTWLFTDALPAIISKLGEWAKAFVDWIGPQIPPMLAKLGELAGQLFSWLTGTALPNIISKLAEWAGAFIAWIAPLIGPMLGKLAEVLGSLVGWMFGTALPAIIGKLAEWAGAFIAWIVPLIPPMLLKLGEVLVSIGGWLIDTALPAIVTKLGEWGAAFIGWIAPMLAALPGKLAEVATAIFNWVTQTARDVLRWAADIGSKILDGIMNGLRGAGEAIGNFLKGVAEAVWNNIVAFFTGEATANVPTTPTGAPLPPPGANPPTIPPGGSRPPIGPPSPPRIGPRGGVGGNSMGRGGDAPMIGQVVINVPIGTKNPYAFGQQAAAGFSAGINERDRLTRRRV